MRKSKLLASVIFMIAMIAGAGSLLAQQRDGRGWGIGPGMMGPGWGRGMRDEDCGMGRRGMMRMGCPMIAYGDNGETTTFIEGRIAFLKAELKITDTQQEVWEGYTKALKSNLETMQSMHQLMQTAFDAKTPVERLDTQLSAMETRLNALKEMKPAVEKLYSALDETQREKADEVLTVMGCIM